MEGVVAPADLARVKDTPPNRLSKNIAHDLAKVMLWTSELSARYYKRNQDFSEENKKNEIFQAKVSSLETELEEDRAKVQAADASLIKAMNAYDEAISWADHLATALATAHNLKEQAVELASQRHEQLEELQNRIEEDEVKAVEDFKNNDEGQYWLA